MKKATGDRKMPTIELLRELFGYDPGTGLFIRRVFRGGELAGSIAGGFDRHGYRRITVDYRKIRANRLAWFWMTGEWPEEEIDHRDLDRDNNRFENLRKATYAQNKANRRVQRNNNTGRKGVGFSRRHKSKPYDARIRVGGKLHHLGMYETADEAHAAYVAAAKEHFGAFARG